MRVLFVCVANENRSQIAEAIFNRLSKKNRARSAGINPRDAGGYVKDMPDTCPVVPMKEHGYDISYAKIKKLDSRMVRWADKVVVLFNWQKHEEEVPAYLRRFKDKELWEVGSISTGTPYDEYCRLERKRIKRIEKLVKGLVKRTG